MPSGARPGPSGQARPGPRSAGGALLLAAALGLLGLRFLRGLFVALGLRGAGLGRDLDRPRQELREVDDLRAASRPRRPPRALRLGRRVAGDLARLDLLVDRGEDRAPVLVGVAWPDRTGPTARRPGAARAASPGRSTPCPRPARSRRPPRAPRRSASCRARRGARAAGAGRGACACGGAPWRARPSSCRRAPSAGARSRARSCCRGPPSSSSRRTRGRPRAGRRTRRSRSSPPVSSPSSFASSSFVKRAYSPLATS